MNAFQQMITPDSFPMYVLFIDLDPSQVDINVHPTKQEIKFEDEKIVYAFVQAAVKHSLAQFSITPTLDFELDPLIQQLDAVSKPFTEEKKAEAASSSLYKTFTQKNQAHFIERENKSELKHWRTLYEGPKPDPGSQAVDSEQTSGLLRTSAGIELLEDKGLVQILNTYIIAQTGRGFILINQQSAHERILYERYIAAAKGKPVAAQRSLFPVTLQLSTQDAVLLGDLIDDLSELGYIIEPFGKDAFIIQGTPGDVLQGNEKNAIENMLEQFKHFTSDMKFSKREKLTRLLAWQHAIKPGTTLTEREMKSLVEELFACSQPNTTPSSRPTYIEFKKEYLETLFGK
jgi:DNA mismatch repair protein MutL